MSKRPIPPNPPPLTPAQFKALAKFKGWSYRALAARWSIQPESVSSIARNCARPVRYDDMLKGLPNLNELAAHERRFAKELAAAELLIRKPADGTGDASIPALPGYRYHGYIVKGSILTAVMDVGTMANEGDRGVVFDVQRDDKRESYGVIFETGNWDWLTPEYIELYVAETGLIDAAASAFQFADAAELRDQFDAGHFTFWPHIPAF